MDLAGHIMDLYLGGLKYTAQEGWHYIYKGKVAKRVLYYHDEYAFECDPEIAEDILELGCQSIVHAGELMGFKVPLASSGKIGHTWADIH